MTHEKGELWPQGTDADGLRSMARGLLCSFLGAVANYIGTQQTRAVLREIADDNDFWKMVNRNAPTFRHFLQEAEVRRVQHESKQRQRH